jgi:hypothetical protein
MPAHPQLTEDMSSAFKDDEELSEDRIHALLAEAESRIRQQSVNDAAEKEKSKAFTNLPKLSAGSIGSPYIRTKGSIAHFDQSRLLSAEQRKLAGTIRKVEDPVLVKQNAIKVSDLQHYILIPTFSYEEIYPKLFLSRLQTLSWGLPAIMRVFIFIVTLRLYILYL